MRISCVIFRLGAIAHHYHPKTLKVICVGITSVVSDGQPVQQGVYSTSIRFNILFIHGIVENKQGKILGFILASQAIEICRLGCKVDKEACFKLLLVKEQPKLATNVSETSAERVIPSFVIGDSSFLQFRIWRTYA